MKRLLIALAVVGLAWLAWNILRGWGGMIRKNSEGSTMGRISSIRSALSIYYGDMEGQYPADLAALTVPHSGKDGKTVTYLSSIEVAQCASPYHPSPSCSNNRAPGVHDKITHAAVPDDAGGWGYNNVAGDPNAGSVWVNCTHTDIRGRSYAAY